MEKQPKRLVRPRQGRMIAGVGLAFANFFNIDVTVARALLVIIAIMGGPGLLLYLIFWVIIPSEQE